MSRIKEHFGKLRREGRKGFIPFVTAGDPDPETSLEIVLTLAEAGADVIELGVPFSDPMADGPTIQRSSQRALNHGLTLADVLELARAARTKTDTPIILFSYLNPLLRFGLSSLVGRAADVGLDGILITDAVDQEAAEYRRRRAGLSPVENLDPERALEGLHAARERGLRDAELVGGPRVASLVDDGDEIADRANVDGRGGSHLRARRNER